MKARRFQKDRPLPLQAAPAEGVFRRRDSRFWQARFRGADGTLHRRTTGTTFRAAALEWLRCAKRTTQSPPPPPSAKHAGSDAGVSDLFLNQP